MHNALLRALLTSSLITSSFFSPTLMLSPLKIREKVGVILNLYLCSLVIYKFTANSRLYFQYQKEETFPKEPSNFYLQQSCGAETLKLTRILTFYRPGSGMHCSLNPRVLGLFRAYTVLEKPHCVLVKRRCVHTIQNATGVSYTY